MSVETSNSSLFVCICARANHCKINGFFFSLLGIVFSGQIRMSKESMHSNAWKSTELVPQWKVHGFRQKSGGVAKDMPGLQKQLKEKEVYHIHTNQVSPHASSSSTPTSLKTKCDNHQAKEKKKQQIAWNKRLMHRTQSALM